MDKIIKQGILAIEPVYLSGRGNCTLIYTEKKGHIEIYKTIRTVIKNICEYYHLDMRAAKKTYGKLLSIKNFPPIPFTPDEVFIYIKTRSPICDHDGAYSYVKVDAIHKLVEKDGKVMVHLTNGDIIKGLAGISTIRKSISNGEIVKKLCKGKSTPIVRETQDFYSQKDDLATKGDIALLYMKMLEIKESMG